MQLEKQLKHFYELTQSDYKIKTLEGHQYYIRYIIESCRSLSVCKLEDIDIEVGYNIRDWLKNNTRYKNNSINRVINYILKVQKYYEIATSLTKLKNLKNDTEPFQRLFRDELKLIIDYVKEMNYSANSIVYRTFILLSLDSGMRQNELLNVEISNIDFENERIYLKVTKTGKVRYAPFSNFSKQEIKDLISINPSRKFLFHNFLKDRQIIKNDIALFYRRLKKALNIERLHTHRFRKTFGSMLAENGMAIEHLQKVYDHSRITTTMLYVQYNESKSLEEYKKYVDWKM